MYLKHLYEDTVYGCIPFMFPVSRKNPEKNGEERRDLFVGPPLEGRETRGNVLAFVS